MYNSRRGFLASMLALIPLARTSNATTVINKLSTIRIISNAALTGFVGVAPLLVSKRQYRAINAGATLDFTGIPGLATAVGALDIGTGAILPVIYTSFPKKGAVTTYYLNYVVDPTTGVGTTTLDAAPVTT